MPHTGQQSIELQQVNPALIDCEEPQPEPPKSPTTGTPSLSSGLDTKHNTPSHLDHKPIHEPTYKETHAVKQLQGFLKKFSQLHGAFCNPFLSKNSSIQLFKYLHLPAEKHFILIPNLTIANNLLIKTVTIGKRKDYLYDDLASLRNCFYDLYLHCNESSRLQNTGSRANQIWKLLTARCQSTRNVQQLNKYVDNCVRAMIHGFCTEYQRAFETNKNPLKRFGLTQENLDELKESLPTETAFLNILNYAKSNHARRRKLSIASIQYHLPGFENTTKEQLQNQALTFDNVKEHIKNNLIDFREIRKELFILKEKIDQLRELQTFFGKFLMLYTFHHPALSQKRSLLRTLFPISPYIILYNSESQRRCYYYHYYKIEHLTSCFESLYWLGHGSDAPDARAKQVWEYLTERYLLLRKDNVNNQDEKELDSYLDECMKKTVSDFVNQYETMRKNKSVFEYFGLPPQELEKLNAMPSEEAFTKILNYAHRGNSRRNKVARVCIRYHMPGHEDFFKTDFEDPNLSFEGMKKRAMTDLIYLNNCRKLRSKLLPIKRLQSFFKKFLLAYNGDQYSELPTEFVMAEPSAERNCIRLYYVKSAIRLHEPMAGYVRRYSYKQYDWNDVEELKECFHFLVSLAHRQESPDNRAIKIFEELIGPNPLNFLSSNDWAGDLLPDNSSPHTNRANNPSVNLSNSSSSSSPSSSSSSSCHCQECESKISVCSSSANKSVSFATTTFFSFSSSSAFSTSTSSDNNSKPDGANSSPQDMPVANEF